MARSIAFRFGVPLTPADARPSIALWLFACAAMVFVMVVLGGLTRLTGSGLSMVEWQPLTLLPPMNEAAWMAEFEKYRRFPEYMKVNAGMSLAEFKGIFWLEYIHRLWGRLIGVVFAVPLLWFWLRGAFAPGQGPRYALIFLLGGLQGVMGWVMVQSGLIDEPRVSPYKLTAHFALALLIYGLLIRAGLNQLSRVAPPARPPARPDASPDSSPDSRGRGRAIRWVTGLAVVTMISGGFVAGNDAGLTYNSFPLMDGRWVPEGLWLLEPGWRNPFENVTLVQFDHRVLAVLTFVAGWALWAWEVRSRRGPARLALHGVAAAVTVQAGLGIATLLHAVPLALGALHQAGALVLFTVLLIAMHATRGR